MLFHAANLILKLIHLLYEALPGLNTSNITKARKSEECTEDEMQCIAYILDYLCDKMDEDIFWIVYEIWLAGHDLFVNALWECRVLHHK